MLGAIAGDIIGSVYEQAPIKRKDFPLFSGASCFTDDTVLTVAIADAVIGRRPYLSALRQFGQLYPDAGYGESFKSWLTAANPQPYNSWGNGAAMRVSALGYACASEAEVLREAQLTAEVTHNHVEGIRGAQATALAIFLARTGASKLQISAQLEQQFGYDLQRSLADIRPTYRFDVSCQGSVPEALIAFLESANFEDAIRNAVSLGGDSDTQACISGAVAEAFYGGVPAAIEVEVKQRLPAPLKFVLARFQAKYVTHFQPRSR